MTTCYWHSDKETGLTCGNCGKPVCTQCLRHHPVGIRCKECVQPALLPTFQLPFNYLLRGIVGMLALGFLGGIGIYLIGALVYMGLFMILMMIGFGYIVGEGISLSVNRKRGRQLQFLSVVSVLIALVMYSFLEFLFEGVLLINVFNLVGFGLSALVATSRLRM